MQALLGIPVFLLIAWALGEDRRAVRPKLVLAGLLMQAVLAFVLLRFPGAAEALLFLSQGVQALETATGEATRFLFGYLGGGAQPFAETGEGNSFIVFFRVLPLVLVVSALSAVLFHWGIVGALVRGLAWVLRRVFGLSGALGFGAGASVFFGIIEAPVLVRPYLAQMSRGELLALLTCCMSTVAGTVMVLYASVVEPVLPGALGHILIASLVSVPAALTIAHLMCPVPVAQGSDAAELQIKPTTTSAVEALMEGTSDGARMLIDITATILVLFALVHLCNMGLASLPHVAEAPLTLQRIAGWGFVPLLWLAGMPWAEAMQSGELMGTKTVLNEFVAYLGLAGGAAEGLSERGRTILVYSMCGFANLGSLGIVVGGLRAALPGRSAELVGLAGRALIAGTLATLSTGAWAGLLG